MYRSRPGSEVGEDERISYECRIKGKDNWTACRTNCPFILFYRNANDIEETRSVFEDDGCMCTHSVRNGYASSLAVDCLFFLVSFILTYDEKRYKLN